MALKPFYPNKIITMNILRLLTTATLTYLLMACTPHPGTGNWLTTGEENVNFVKEFARLDVDHDGRTDIFNTTAGQQNDAADPSSAVRRCFWRGQDAQTILMTCVVASDTDVEESYLLRVNPDGGVADLIKGETVIGRFVRE